MPRLKAPTGTDEASVGEHLYRVDNNGQVEAPAEDVAGLMTAGFTDADPPLPAVPVGSVRLQGPANAGGVAFGGQEYPADERGHVIVPAAAVADLASHGFIVVDTVSATENPAAAPEAPEAPEPAPEAEAEPAAPAAE